MHRQDLQSNSETDERASFIQTARNITEKCSKENKRFPERLSKEHIKNYPVLSFKGKIHLIRDKNELKEALKILGRESVLGFDTETRPSFKKGENYSVSLLQLSTLEEAFLFRINYLGLPDELVSLLANQKILKVGVAILDDVRALRKLKEFDAEGFVELANIGSELGIVTCGLRNMAAIFFGVRISKKAQLTNWDRTDFNSDQALYAATDAWICLKMYYFLESENLLPEKIIWKMPNHSQSRRSNEKKNEMQD